MNEKLDYVPGLISVIVASYNHAEYLKKRMDSLITQTYTNFEIIVIDDCSTDNSVEILQDYEENPKVCLIINNENEGWVRVSNKGVSKSRGEYIIFANCDDYSDINQLEKLAKSFSEYPNLAMSFSSSKMIDENNCVLSNDFYSRTIEFQNYCRNDILIPRKKMVRFLMHSCIIPNLSGLLIRKSSFLKSGGFSSDFNVVSDWDLFFNLSLYGDTFWIREPLNYFRQHEETIRATTKDKRIYDEIFIVLYKQFQRWDFKLVDRLKFYRYIDSIWISYILKKPKSAIKNFKDHFILNYNYNKKVIFLLTVHFLTFPFFKIFEHIKSLDTKEPNI